MSWLFLKTTHRLLRNTKVNMPQLVQPGYVASRPARCAGTQPANLPASPLWTFMRFATHCVALPDCSLINKQNGVRCCPLITNSQAARRCCAFASPRTHPSYAPLTMRLLSNLMQRTSSSWPSRTRRHEPASMSHNLRKSTSNDFREDLQTSPLRRVAGSATRESISCI